MLGIQTRKELLGVVAECERILTRTTSSIPQLGSGLNPGKLQPLASDVVEIIPRSRDVFESTLFERLFSDEFKPKMPDWLGNGSKETTVIDRITGKPVQIHIEDHGYNRHFFFDKEGDPRERFLGYVEITSKTENSYGDKGTRIEMMDATKGNEKYRGIGIRMHQLAIEESLRHGTDGNVFFSVDFGSAPFHYKSGFRPKKAFNPVTTEELEKLLIQYKVADAQLSLEEITQMSGNQLLVDMSAVMNEAAIRNAILRGEKTYVSPYMELRGEHLQAWKDRIAKQPLLR